MNMMKKIETAKRHYAQSKLANVGEQCKCPTCGSTFTKRTNRQAFCGTRGGTKCKDGYWNLVDERKRNNHAHYLQKKRSVGTVFSTPLIVVYDGKNPSSLTYSITDDTLQAYGIENPVKTTIQLARYNCSVEKDPANNGLIATFPFILSGIKREAKFFAKHGGTMIMPYENRTEDERAFSLDEFSFEQNIIIGFSHSSLNRITDALKLNTNLAMWNLWNAASKRTA